MSHPYKDLPDRNFWKKSVAEIDWSKIFLSEKGKFTITREDIVSMAGSCFAQRISSLLKISGFNCGNFEAPHALMAEQESRDFGYGLFSARYGNIYTIRQLRQLIEEAFGLIEPRFKMARSKDNQLIDLLRPGVHAGWVAEIEAQADRLYHLQCVKALFSQSNIFIFTLGLTEAWVDSDDGTAYGIHPGVSLGRNYERDIAKVNFDYLDCYNDLVFIVNFLREINVNLKFIFTVSPVALAATHENKHVLVATTYSKSVLRAVVGRLTDQCLFADYFMAYEIFSSAQSFGQYLSGDLRDISMRGVDVAMQTFKQMYFAESSNAKEMLVSGDSANFPSSSEDLNPAKVECEEIFNALFR